LRENGPCVGGDQENEEDGLGGLPMTTCYAHGGLSALNSWTLPAFGRYIIAMESFALFNAHIRRKVVEKVQGTVRSAGATCAGPASCFDPGREVWFNPRNCCHDLLWIRLNSN
jgi:hypothetical protein